MASNVFGSLFENAKQKRKSPVPPPVVALKKEPFSRAEDEDDEEIAEPKAKKSKVVATAATAGAASKKSSSNGTKKAQPTQQKKKRGMVEVAQRNEEEMVETVDPGEDDGLGKEARELWKSLLKGVEEEKQEKAKEAALAVGLKEVVPAPPKYEERKIFIGNLSSGAKQKKLIELFSAFGKVKEVLVPKPKKAGEKPSAAFLEFEDEASVEPALAAMDGKKIGSDVARVTRVHRKVPKANTTGSTTLFVRNVAFDVSSDAISHFFADCGTVRRVRLPVFPDTKKPKGIAFVEFDTPQAVTNALRKNRASLNGRQILCDVAAPKPPPAGGNPPAASSPPTD